MTRHRVAVAASGGRDSTALLHCTVRAAHPLGIDVCALHVHHGLSDQAGAWLSHVRRQARRWGADFSSCRLDGSPAAGDSVEAWARAGRYRALADMARHGGFSAVMLAHHRRDQAETVLLQALRGAGPAGLSAMPRATERGAVTWLRPWLNQPREAIEAYVRRHRLSHVDDASNDNVRLARNRLRHGVWPALLQAFPDAESALVTAARRNWEAAELAREAAEADQPALLQGDHLVVSGWLGLPPARRRNALRFWLQGRAGGRGEEALLDRLLAELPVATAARWPCAAGELGLHRGLLAVLHASDPDLVPAAAITLSLDRPGCHRLPSWGGEWHVQTATEHGILSHRLGRLTARRREGGERFRSAAGAPSRSLKQAFQTRQVPPWQRDGPLLFDADGVLIFVPGLGIEASAMAPAGVPQLTLRWVRDDPPTFDEAESPA